MLHEKIHSWYCAWLNKFTSTWFWPRVFTRLQRVLVSSIRLSVCSFITLCFLRISWQIPWKEWPRIWYAGVFRWLTPQSLLTPMGIIGISRVHLSVHLSVSLGCGICRHIDLKEWPQFTMSLYPVDLPQLPSILMSIIVISCVRPSVHLSVAFSLGICRQIAWRKWPTNPHAHVSKWLTLGRHQCRCEFFAFVQLSQGWGWGRIGSEWGSCSGSCCHHWGIRGVGICCHCWYSL